MQILNFGSLNIDHVYNVDHFVAPGETLCSADYKINADKVSKKRLFVSPQNPFSVSLCRRLEIAVVKTFETGPMRPLSKVFFSTLFINSYLQVLSGNFLQIDRAFAISASCADVSD